MNREKNVNRAVMKKDAMALVTGAPVYTDDLAPKDCLVVKVLRSPHAHALVKTIDTKRASAVPGIACVLTWEDSPACRFTQAGQTYPEPSPYDRRIIDRRLRFVGDVVAIVAGDTEQAVDRALKLIKTEYEVLKPVLDFRKAKDNPVLVHPEEDWKSLCPVGADNKRNLCSSGSESDGDVEAVLKDWCFCRPVYRVKEEEDKELSNQEFSKTAMADAAVEDRRKLLLWLNDRGMELEGDGRIGSLAENAENLFTEQITFCRDIAVYGEE